MDTQFSFSGSVPSYICARIDRPIAVSGKMDDPLWATAEPIVLVDAVSGQPAGQATTARLLYDSKQLYVSFECADDYIWGTKYERDDEIFTEECVEVFLCSSGKLRQYFEINVSPLNTVFDAVVLNGRRRDESDRKLDAISAYDCEGLQTMVHVDGKLGVPGATGWSAEYAIPFASLIGHDNLSPEPGDEWRMNLYRIDSPEPGNQVLYAWSPPGREDFHLPWRFGRLIFG